jgi:restriction system protein
LAIVGYIVLSALAMPVAVTAVQPGDIAHVATQAMWKAFAYAGQFIVPAACLIAAVVSAYRRHERKQLVSNVTGASSSDALGDMTWREFEVLVGEGFRLQGYEVNETGGGGADGGVDLVLRKDREKFLVQCKQWKAFKVGVTVVRELYGVMAAHGAAGGFVVTSGRFTDDAKAFADGRNIRLVAYFSDRGRLFQADRGRRISVAAVALGKRAGTGLTVAESSTISLKRAAVGRESRPVLSPT